MENGENGENGRPPPPPPGGLGERIVNGFRYLIGLVDFDWERPFVELGKAVQAAMPNWLEPLAITPMYKVYRALGVSDKEIAAYLEEMGVTAKPIGWTEALGWAVAIWGLIWKGNDPANNALAKRAVTLALFRVNRETPLFRLASQDGVIATLRGEFTMEKLRSDLADLGIDDERKDAVVASAYRWLSSGQILELYRRGELEKEAALELMKGVGLQDYQAEELLKLKDYIPPVTHVTRMAIREVFTPEFQERLKRPGPGEDYYKWAEKTGLTREVAEFYWMAHWRLPSISAGYDMFRRYGPDRGKEFVFSEQDLRDLMRLDDMLEHYHDGLIKVQYRPLSRLDVWRLAQAGDFPEETVKDWYLDYGYSPETSALIAHAAVGAKLDRERDLSRSDITSMLQRGVLEEEDAEIMLSELGYSPEETALYLSRVAFDRAKQEASGKTSTIRARFKNGLLDAAGAINELTAIGKPPVEVQQLVELWVEELRADPARLTRAQVLGLYRDRIITQPTLREELAGLRYADRDAGWIIDQADAAMDEEEARRDETELKRRLRLVKNPTRADLKRWLETKLITIEEFTRRLFGQGFSAEDVARYALEAGVEPVVLFYKTEEGRLRLATIKTEFRRGFIDSRQLREELPKLGIPQDIADAIADYEEVKIAPSPAEEAESVPT